MTTMDYSRNIAELSPEKQELLKLLLLEETLETNTFPLSFAQRRLWFIEQIERGSYVYNICASVRLRGHLNVNALEQSFDEIVRRHESLRTTFQLMDQQPVQVVARTLHVKPSLINLKSLPEAERETEVQRLLQEESQTPFDLTRGPLLRVKLLRLATDEHVLLLTLHHIISDGWSMGVLVREMVTLYESLTREQPSTLAELPVQYTDFVTWQHEWLRGQVLEEHLSYWKQQLAGAPALLEFPANYPRPAINTHRGAKQSMSFPLELSNALKAFSEREHVTLFMTLLAAFKTLCYRYTGQEDIVVGTPIAGRNRAETEALIGFFVNTLVLRTDLSDNPSFTDLLRRVREVCLGAYAHQDLPFEKLVEELQPARSLSHTPLFQVMFVLQNTPMTGVQLPELELTPIPVDNHTSKFDLTLFMEETSHGLIGTLEYNTEVFDVESIRRLLDHFHHLLRAILSNPRQRLSRLPLLPDQQRRLILQHWNHTSFDWSDALHSPHSLDSSSLTLTRLFEQQVLRSPNAPAL
ncbi:MAG TPA: condensation domain-containing protein, partial [Pyrinomonadaceae bacterium]|nr:condensation domain-containing protein [Pyrinomonadaceae bacterium]